MAAALGEYIFNVLIFAFILPLFVIAVVLFLLGINKKWILLISLAWFFLQWFCVQIFLGINVSDYPFRAILVVFSISLIEASLCFYLLGLGQVSKTKRMTVFIALLFIQNAVFFGIFWAGRPHYARDYPLRSNFVNFQGKLYIITEPDGLYQITEDNRLIKIAPLPEVFVDPHLVSNSDNIYVMGKVPRLFQIKAKTKPKLFRFSRKIFGEIPLPHGTRGIESLRIVKGHLMAVLSRWRTDGRSQKETWMWDQGEWKELPERAWLTLPIVFDGKWLTAKPFSEDIIISSSDAMNSSKLSAESYRLAQIAPVGNTFYALDRIKSAPGSYRVLEFDEAQGWLSPPWATTYEITDLYHSNDSLFFSTRKGESYRLINDEPSTVRLPLPDLQQSLQFQEIEGSQRFVLDGEPCFEKIQVGKRVLECGNLKYFAESDLFKGRIEYRRGGGGYTLDLEKNLISVKNVIYGVTYRCHIVKYSKLTGMKMASAPLAGCGKECRLFDINQKLYVISRNGLVYQLLESEWSLLNPPNGGKIVNSLSGGHPQFYLIDDNLFFSSGFWLYKYEDRNWNMIMDSPDRIKDVTGSNENLFVSTAGHRVDKLYMIDDRLNAADIGLGGYTGSIFYKDPFLYISFIRDGVYYYKEGQMKKIRTE